jgi:ribosome-associated toxin RatA of RatAB toxin-antitoxin module
MIVRRSALVPRPATHVFDVIEAAEHYPQFLPWCTGATIVSRDAAAVSADLRMNWGGMQFEMRTRNPKLRPSLMSIHLERGPFRRFEGEWRLTELSADACKVAFVLEYEFESRWMTGAAGPVFNRIGDTMLDAFVARALAMPVIAMHTDVGALCLAGAGGGEVGPLSLEGQGRGEAGSLSLEGEGAETTSMGAVFQHASPTTTSAIEAPLAMRAASSSTAGAAATAAIAAAAATAASAAPAAPAPPAAAPRQPPVDVPAGPATGEAGS